MNSIESREILVPSPRSSILLSISRHVRQGFAELGVGSILKVSSLDLLTNDLTEAVSEVEVSNVPSAEEPRLLGGGFEAFLSRTASTI